MYCCLFPSPDESLVVPVSAWHDIPLKNQNSNLFHYVIEITKGSHAKLEIQTQEFLNPIVQDKYVILRDSV